jgi:hypothetical protein
MTVYVRCVAVLRDDPEGVNGIDGTDVTASRGDAYADLHPKCWPMTASFNSKIGLTVWRLPIGSPDRRHQPEEDIPWQCFSAAV